MAKKSCRRTMDENKIHEKAVKMRKKTDEQLVHYVEDRVEKARSEGFNEGKALAKNTTKEFIVLLQQNKIPGIGYEDRGIAVIDKTPEAFKVIKPYNRDRGQFICCFTQQAQPDFKGALMDSTMVLFDAKHTDKGQISRNVVTEEQEECFERYMKMGAMCFLVISLEFEEFYRVPWIVFRDMKKIYGHKYMNREELAPYRVKYNNGVVKYLDGITLRERNEDESTEV